MLDKLGIPDRKAYVGSNFPEAINLDSVSIAPQLQAQLEAVVEEAVSNESWTDASFHLPTALNQSDISLLCDLVLRGTSKLIDYR